MKCKNCGANWNQIECEYCGTRSMVKSNTGVFYDPRYVPMQDFQSGMIRVENLPPDIPISQVFGQTNSFWRNLFEAGNTVLELSRSPLSFR